VAQLKAGVTQATIHQRLRDEHGLRASVASLIGGMWLRTWPRRSAATRLWCCAIRFAAGEEAQIDYGHLGWWVDPTVGRGRKVWRS